MNARTIKHRLSRLFNDRTPHLGSLREVLQEFLEKLNHEVGFESGSLFLLDSETQRLKEMACVGDGIDFISSVHFPMGSGLSAWVAQKGKLIYLPDIHRGSRHGENPVRSYLSIPLEVDGRIIGVLNLGHVVPNAFDQGQLERIKRLSRDLAGRIHELTMQSAEIACE